MLTTHNIDIQAMLVWLTLPFYDFCGFRSVTVNTVYKQQFFTFISRIGLHGLSGAGFDINAEKGGESCWHFRGNHLAVGLTRTGQNSEMPKLQR